jgi:TetR/AcrR family transcriptional regulator, transcriptional repressor for nem operon
MRLTRAESERNRKRILEVAGRLFRQRGFDGVGVDDLMKAAGFTHGGFYNHFGSKAELEAEASAAGTAQAKAALVESLSDPRKDGWERFVRGYLSAEHRREPAAGCTLGALAADAARKGPKVQARFAEAVEGMAGALADHLARKPSRGKRALARRERALQMLSELVGALVLARAVAAADPALSDEILAANRRGLR